MQVAIANNVPPGMQAFGGAPLVWGRHVRVIYLDETGHSAGEKVAAVAGVMLDPDRQWLLLNDQLARIRQLVPSELGNDFVFHAADLYHGGKYRKSWRDKEARWRVLEEVLSLPRLLGIPIVLGFANHGEESESGASVHRISVLSHARAYARCIVAADALLTRHTENEICMVVAEDRGEARRALVAVQRLISDDALRQRWLPEASRRALPQVTRVKSPPAFAGKQDEPLLQIADAIAYVFQRFLNDAPESSRFMAALIGDFMQPVALGSLRTRLSGFFYMTWAPSGG